MVNQEVTMLFDRILEWREHRNALTNGRSSTAAESPVIGPLSHERSLKAAVKYVLKTMGCAMSPPLIQAMLEEMGFPMGKYTVRPLLSIHPTLKRLVADGCVRQVPGHGKSRVWKEYEWIDPG
ncbi:MAG: hypothetical protein ACLP07_03510 [Terracidiphilus sp.]